VKRQGGSFPAGVRLAVEKISKNGGTPLVVAERQRCWVSFI